jgi:orotate phosphoribosyltransferase
MSNGKEIAKAGLEIKAIKLRPDDPFTWASGFRMPIYNDNRMFLFNPQHRQLLARGFENIMGVEEYDIIAGTSTAGISPGTTLADSLWKPFIYVRDKPKDHGLKNQIEGIDAESNLEGRSVILVEDLISTGGSSVRAVQAIRDANGACNTCMSIFNYGFDKAQGMFNGEEAYDKEGNKLEAPCTVRSLLTYDTLLEVARETRYINDQQAGMLAEWRADPFGWGEKHGFPKVEK